ncbi:hypothetical protein [Amycolatopsis cihanbeyliensis]|uniref:Uncharacterized protein n=1 Tax=Amycolatopsis cihanbeyliensis TaxID=1128664 RepID=A0A542DKM8_AMYCI|nr:hypothetical protein [Amycolatopsis cihanbeyliensis]TQJ03646.1 hypothetical protein FB471_3408 [Amycolatopsis cihanbeyliensis]
MTTENGATDYVSFVRGYLAAMSQDHQDFYGRGIQEYEAMGQALPSNSTLSNEQDGKGFFAGTLDLSGVESDTDQSSKPQRQTTPEPAN